MSKKTFPYSLLGSQKKLPLLLVSRKLIIQDANEAFLKLCSTKQNVLKNAKLGEALPKQLVKPIEKALKGVVEKKVVSSSYSFTGKKGEILEGKFSVVDCGKDSPILMIFTPGEDIERLKSEIDAVNRIADHNLKKLVKANEKLHDARRAEQEALNIKEKFLTNISHELRTPLTGISGISQLLAKTRLSPQQKEYVDNILRSADNLISIINELLDLSKIKSGKFELDLQEFSLYECLKNVASAFSIISNNKNITFNFSYDKKIPPVLIGDSLRISQIINNLLNNSFKFTDDGYIHLNVTEKKIIGNTAWIDFEVTDTGIGIEKEKLQNIFEEFKQAEAGTSRLYGGTGLGLSICQHLVRLHQGEIDVKSKPGEGSSFYFTLPLPIGKKIKQSDVKLSERLKGVKVLVADDNMVNILVIENILKKEGAEVFSASDGKEAYQKFKMQEVDMVLLDLNMPKMDGYELARILRKKEKSLLPIAAVTAGNPDSVQKKCQEAGFSDIIFKPFKNEDFVNRLLTYLKQEIQPVKEQIDQEEENVSESADSAPDFVTLNSLASGDAGIFNELLKSIIENIETEIPRLNEALNAEDKKQIYFVAHKIKTSYGYVNVKNDLEHLRSIEILAENDGPVPEMRELFEPVLNNYLHLIQTLKSSFK